MILTQTIHCQPARAPLVVRGRTQAHGCCLPHTHAPTPYHSSSFTQSCARPPGDNSHPTSPHPCDQPASLTTAHHPRACPSLCFTLRCAVNNNNTHRHPGVETARRLCGRPKKSTPESWCGKSTLWSLASVAVGADKYICPQRRLRSQLALHA